MRRSKQDSLVNAAQLASNEPLSPELVLVLPPELRARVLADLPAPVWPAPGPRGLTVPPAGGDAVERSLGRVIASRATQLALLFVVLTIATIVMSVIAHVVR